MADRRKTLQTVTNRLSYSAAPTKPGRQSMAGAVRMGGWGAGAGAGAGGGGATERRRSSARASYGGARGGSSSDPRPLKSKRFLEGEAARLMDVLSGAYRGPYPLGPYPYQIHDMVRKGGPTGRQFKEMVSFLLSQVDPTFRIEASIDKELPDAFKCLNYPYAISRNSLSAVGSPHTWPQLLVALTWLVDLIHQGRASMDAKEADPDTFSRRHMAAHTLKSYQAFLQANDELEEELLIADKAVVFEEIEKEDAEVASLEEEKEALQARLKELQSKKSAVPDLKNNIQRYTSDVKAMREFCVEQEKYQKTMLAKEAETSTQLATKERELAEAREFNAELERRRNAQELSAADVQRMRQEGELLKEGIRSAIEVREQSQAQVHVLDRDYQRLLADTREAVAAYNDEVAPVAKAKDSDTAEMAALKCKLTVDVAFDTADATPTLTNAEGGNPKDVKAALKALEKAFHSNALEVAMMTQTVEAKVEAANDGKRDKDKANHLLEQQLRKLEDTLREEKEALEVQVEEAGTEMESVQSKTDKLRAEIEALQERAKEVTAPVLNRLATQVKQEETMLAKERGKLHASIVAAMSKLTKHVTSVQQTLNTGVSELEAIDARLTAALTEA